MRRLSPLIDIVFAYKIDQTTESFFQESKKIKFIKTMVKSCSWRYLPLLDPILNECILNLGNPYKQIRDVVGMTLRDIFGLLWYPSFSSSSALVLSAASGQFRRLYKEQYDTILKTLKSKITQNKLDAESSQFMQPLFINTSRTSK